MGKKKLQNLTKKVDPEVATHTSVFLSLITCQHIFWTIRPVTTRRCQDSGGVRVRHRVCIFMRGLWLDLCFLRPLTLVYPHMLLAHEWRSGSPLIFSAHVHRALTESWGQFVFNHKDEALSFSLVFIVTYLSFLESVSFLRTNSGLTNVSLQTNIFRFFTSWSVFRAQHWHYCNRVQ